MRVVRELSPILRRPRTGYIEIYVLLYLYVTLAWSSSNLESREIQYVVVRSIDSCKHCFSTNRNI